MTLTRRIRVDDLREFHGVAWVESLTEMRSRLTQQQRDDVEPWWSEQLFLLERDKPSPRLDPTLASAADEDMDPRVAYAITNRRLLRRANNGT